VQVARGLHHAHRRSVYHRDIKPGNIRVLADGQVKIMDFGVAKFLSETPSELTQTGTIVGTGHYMSPEQIQGLAVDQRSDIFSFGVVLYELLSDRKPFDGDTFTQVMYKIVNSPPPPFPAELRIPDELVAVVNQCLEKNLRDRFSDFAPIIRRLEGLAEDLSADSELYLGTEVARLLAESERLMHESKYTEAITALDRARELAPTSREIEHRLEAARREGSIRRGIAAGDELGEAGKLEEALERYRAVLRIDPDSAPVRLAIQRTEKLLDEALRRKDETERMEKLLKAGRDLLQVKQVKQAADCFDQILALKPDHQDAIALRAECEAAQGRLRQIAELIDEGRRQMAALNFEAAERALAQVRKIDSSHFEASELLREVERVREARRSFERAEDATHGGDWETAAIKLREVIRLEPGFPGAREGLDRAEAELATAGRLRAVQRLLRRGKLEEAASELRSVLGDRPEHAGARALMAQVEAEIEEGKTPVAPAPSASADDATRIMTPPPGDRAVWESPVKGAPAGAQPPRGASSVDHEQTMITKPAKAKPAPAPKPAPPPAAKAAPTPPPAKGAPPKPAAPRPAPKPAPATSKPRSRGALVAAAVVLLVGLGSWAILGRNTGDKATSPEHATDPPPPQSEEKPAPVPGEGTAATPLDASAQEPPKEPAAAEQPPAPDPEQPKSLAARDAARKAKDEARSKEALRWAPETYRKAEQHEEQAADALIGGSFADATRGFESARKEFASAADQAVREKARDAKDQAAKEQAAKEKAAKEAAAKEAASKKVVAPPAPPPAEPANGAPRVDPAAAEAERLAQQAAARGAELNASYPGYAAASEAETRGKQALAAKQYGEAVTQLSSAVEGYDNGRTQRSAQEAAVADLLRRYDAAFEAADINALSAISTLDATERGRWSQFFKMATDIRAEVTPTSTKYDPNGAQIGLQVKLSYLSTDRKRVDTSFNKSLYATERDGRWLLVNR
jgi:hypothetical protein